MYGLYGKINSKAVYSPSDRALKLRKIVDAQSREVYRDVRSAAEALTEANLPLIQIKQVELALSTESVAEFFASPAEKITPAMLNNLLYLIERSGLSDTEARCVLEDLFYSIRLNTAAESLDKLKADVENEDDSLKYKHIPPYLYRDRLQKALVMISNGDSVGLTDDVQEEINMLADCNVGEANYILSLMYTKGLGVKRDYSLAAKYARKAAALKYPSAYALLGDLEYDNNRFDEAYEYYSKPGAIALDKVRAKRVDNLFAAKSFADKVCISLWCIYAVLVALMIFVVNSLTLSGTHPVLLTLFIVLMTLVMGYVMYLHYTKPLKDLRQWSLALTLIFTLFTVFALI